MNVTIIAYGTRGEVQPMLALAKGRQGAEHGVPMLAGSNLQEWIEAHRIAVTARGIGAAALGALIRAEDRLGIAVARIDHCPPRAARIIGAGLSGGRRG
ncbi:MAG TPA: glycosyltransferase [Anaerolineae bacterium]|nr:glycosyltransferase [Anaerolineae bacterium]